jgi:hypothetical protein
LSSTACIIGKELSFSVEVSVTLGGSLDGSNALCAGVGSQASKTPARGTALVGQTKCAGPWSCSVLVTPRMRNVNCFSKTAIDCRAKHFDCETPYTVQFPVDAGFREKYAVVNISPCACKNKAAWADRGAPPPCPKDC